MLVYSYVAVQRNGMRGALLGFDQVVLGLQLAGADGIPPGDHKTEKEFGERDLGKRNDAL